MPDEDAREPLLSDDAQPAVPAADASRPLRWLVVALMVACAALARAVAVAPAASSYLGDCAGPPSCAADPRVSAGSNRGSVGTSGSLWKAEKASAYAGKRLFAAGPPAPRRPAEHGPPRCDRWAVVTTIFPATKTVRQLAALEGWCTVVVGDLKSPNRSVFLSGVPPAAVASGALTYLDPGAQRALPFRVGKRLRWNHFGRKNLGFAYAVAHGARVVYDTDDDNELVDGGALKQWAAALLGGSGPAPGVRTARTCARAFNPYPLFGSRRGDTGEPEFAWPRGFPLEALRTCASAAEDPASGAKAAPRSAVGIVQSLAGHDPDVDAIYRLRHHLPLDFEGRGTGVGPVALPAGTVAPLNAQATLWAPGALPGLLLPCSVHGRVSDIWRGYLAQAALGALGQRVVVASPWVRQVRNPHTYLADFDAELPLYRQAGTLVDWLTDRWRPPPPGEDVPEGSPARALALVEDVTIAAHELGLLALEDVELQQAWLQDLVDAGFLERGAAGAGSGAGTTGGKGAGLVLEKAGAQGG
mmetsp:Transcript_12756/g.43182  ORF Transcript_12756/g.43182 Transcript_12756/m.43182 type:complete len:529 (-) Transcript_12756:167-1753(-)|eukprot:CAMPEP_0206016450 /NCGR_PEP_ID=MMETSP1464-20131121/22822_1 /ASSEMBLY_ACC=CAM_ASM_001124 /TAXON_ID=119497 /ORGANISM="Exanthemachrysis gayraliae, Strain RCC1523" /LENGTH=528 /DNA_ID=CAMNT_0053390265 /DNA_START=33 /DNA_END=1619 /DNA_ORIENTATION=-